ncbi:unnamed protein product [Ectocarpus sp. 12 AP-2014]
MGRQVQLHQDGLLGGPQDSGSASEGAGGDGHAGRISRLGRSPNRSRQTCPRGGGDVHPEPVERGAGASSGDGRTLETAAGGADVLLSQAVDPTQPTRPGGWGLGGILRPRYKLLLVP